MHSAVLQNKEYIEFAEENTVEVIALGSLDEGIEKQDRKAGTYKAKDEAGNDVDYLVEFPGLTVEQVNKLNASPAGQYNKTSRIPYTALVNPQTLEELQSWSGGQSSKTIMEAVKVHRKALDKQYGEGPSRKTFTLVREKQADIRQDLADGKLDKAVAGQKALATKMAKQPEAVQALIAKTQAEILEVAGKQLDEAEAKVAAGEGNSIVNALSKLAALLRDTTLADRANTLLAKAKE
ncbi:MAG: hypothetical protein ACT4PV_12485 [Planctomycetaceae bacterium]